MAGKRVDANQAEIVKALREHGASVELLHETGRGVPDLMAGFRGRNYLMEVKTDKGKLNARQKKWHKEWKGGVWVVRRIYDALAIIEYQPPQSTTSGASTTLNINIPEDGS